MVEWGGWFRSLDHVLEHQSDENATRSEVAEL